MQSNEKMMETAPSDALQGEEELSDFKEVRTIPLPFQPVDINHARTFPVQLPGMPLGFTINGQMVQLHAGGTTEFKLNSNPPGSATGFTNVHHINKNVIINEETPEEGMVPVISGVFSGQAAKKVLNDLDLNVNTQKSLMPTVPKKIPGTNTSAPAQATKIFHKGQLSHIPPSTCGVCMSPFKVVRELRGFMCRCSPSILESLKALRIVKQDLSSRERKKKMSSSDSRRRRRVSQTQLQISECPKQTGNMDQPGEEASSLQNQEMDQSSVSPVLKSVKMPDAAPSEPVIGADPGSPIHLLEDLHDLPPVPEGKLVATVDDFYYNANGGPTTHVQSQYKGTYKCILCFQRLSSNIELMSHMKIHATGSSLSKAVPSCPHCLRLFKTSFQLQCHLKDVHWNHPNPVKCKICELVFDSEQKFLVHMKNTHEPGEMPYVCQVCNFRSSFFSDVWFHFEEFHAKTKHLLCQYCLRVLHNGSCYQRHFIRHQNKALLSCDQCRLHFLYVKDRSAHKLVHHSTHVKPTHLARLRPGTKVSVRVYSREAGTVKPVQDESEGIYLEEKVSIPEDTKSNKECQLKCLPFNVEMESDNDLGPPHCCVECLNSIQDFNSHFPSVVRCSLCSFSTCCSRAYANHMINNHTNTKRRSQYCTIFQSPPRLREKLSCGICSFQSWRGDVMANHLLEEQEHYCVTTSEWSVDEQQKLTETEGHLAASTDKSPCRGSFVPIELVSPDQTSSELSVTIRSSLSFTCRPAMTIKFRDVQKPWSIQRNVTDTPPSAPNIQLRYRESLLLFSLLNGVPRAARLFNRRPVEIWEWTSERKKKLASCEWQWNSEKLVVWLLSCWEQQLHVSQNLFLDEAMKILGESSVMIDRFSWAVDFLLYHRFHLHNNRKCLLPQNVRNQGQNLVRSLCAKVQKGDLTPRSVGFMDELPIFIHMEGWTCRLSNFHLLGMPGELPLFEVLVSGLADGTFLTPLLLFRGKCSVLPEGFPSNVFLQAQPEGFMDEDRLSLWTDKVWRRHAEANPQSLLLLDVHYGHLMDKFHSRLSDMSTELVFLPPSCSSLVQPLDVCVMPVLRHFLQARWTQLESQGGLESLSLDQLAQTMTCWLSEVTSILRAQTHFLSRSFAEVCQLQPDTDSEEVAQLLQTLTDTLCQETASAAGPAGGDAGALR
ncbi:pogo transposable element with ZNF domain isoform 3-T3 [Synchiropus picturatus]